MEEIIFRTKNGKVTDILHSYPYYKATAKQRNDLAFNKTLLKQMSKRDRDIMYGYGAKIIQDQNAFKYRNPNYQRKTTGTYKPTTAKALRDQFFVN